MNNSTKKPLIIAENKFTPKTEKKPSPLLVSFKIQTPVKFDESINDIFDEVNALINKEVVISEFTLYEDKLVLGFVHTKKEYTILTNCLTAINTCSILLSRKIKFKYKIDKTIFSNEFDVEYASDTRKFEYKEESTTLPTNLARAYATTVVVNGMFNSIQKTLISGSFQSSSFITSAFCKDYKKTEIGKKQYKVLEKYTALIHAISRFGESLTEQLAFGFEKDNIDKINSADVTLYAMSGILQQLSTDELQELSEMIEKNKKR